MATHYEFERKRERQRLVAIARTNLRYFTDDRELAEWIADLMEIALREQKTPR